MTQRTDGKLGDAFTTLSSSAGGLSDEMTDLNRAIGDLQRSTERWSENQAATSKSLSDAAASLATLSEQPAADPDTSGFAVADD